MMIDHKIKAPPAVGGAMGFYECKMAYLSSVTFLHCTNSPAWNLSR